jgi:YEATS domain-containing protein 4
VIETPPYEVTEHGWGEFELNIKIHFVDPLEVPVDLVHALVLYPPEGNVGLSTKKPVIKEIYDEIEFHDPTESFYKILKDHEMMSVGSSPHPLAINRGRGTAPDLAAPLGP